MQEMIEEALAIYMPKAEADTPATTHLLPSYPHVIVLGDRLSIPPLQLINNQFASRLGYSSLVIVDPGMLIVLPHQSTPLSSFRVR